MKIDAYSTYDLGQIIYKNFPPVGWYIDVAIRELDENTWEIEVSSPMTSGSWIQWPKKLFVHSVKNDTNNIPYYPEHYGETEKEALENLCDEIAEEIISAFQEWKREKGGV